MKNERMKLHEKIEEKFGFCCEQDPYIASYDEIRSLKEKGMAYTNIAQSVKIDPDVLKHDIFKDYAFSFDRYKDRCYIPSKSKRHIDVLEKLHKDGTYAYDIILYFTDKLNPTMLMDVDEDMFEDFLKSCVHGAIINDVLSDPEVAEEDKERVKQMTKTMIGYREVFK